MYRYLEKMFRSKFGRRRNYRKSRFAKRSRPVRKVSKSVRRYVKKAIHRSIENKEIIDYWSNQTLSTLSSGTNSGGSCRQLLPLPAQGTQENQRVGNQIRVVSGVIKGHINIKPYDVALNPLGTPLLGKIWLFRDLTHAGTQFITNGSYTSYFDDFFKGNNTTLPFQGLPIDMDLPINQDHFRLIKTKTFKIGASYASATGPVGTGGYFDNSPMVVPFYFNWTKYCKKVLKFVDQTGSPSNDNLYMVVQVVRADGTSSGSYQMAEWHAVNTIKYEDA